MKKQLLLLLIAPVLGFGQVLTDVLYLSGFNVNPVMTDARSQNTPAEINTPSGVISNTDPLEKRVTMYTVPDGKLWKITHIQNGNVSSNAYIAPHFGFSDTSLIIDSPELGFYDKNWLDDNGNYFTLVQYEYYDDYGSNAHLYKEGFFLKEGTRFWFNLEHYLAVINEYTLDTSSLSYNEAETIQNNSNTPVLFPNPTSSLLALNSNKEYDIEVYDMAGNKVMALTGNTIDMSDLSSATYIVKALDKVENEEVSYKVVKN